MVKNKKIGIVLTLGLSGCASNVSKEKETTTTKTKVESTVSKNDAEKENKTEEKETKNENKATNEESKVEDKTTTTNSKSKSSSNTTSKSSTGSSSSSSTSKPSTGSSSSSTTNNSSTGSSSSSSTNNSSTGRSSNSTTSKPERTWEYMSSLSEQTFSALNAYRQANGVAALTYSSSEQARANAQAEYNAKTMTFSHDIDQISLGNGTANPQAYINQWANSSGHKKNMLDEGFTEGAVAVYKDSENNYYVVASFHLDW